MHRPCCRVGVINIRRAHSCVLFYCLVQGTTLCHHFEYIWRCIVACHVQSTNYVINVTNISTIEFTLTLCRWTGRDGNHVECNEVLVNIRCKPTELCSQQLMNGPYQCLCSWLLIRIKKNLSCDIDFHRNIRIHYSKGTLSECGCECECECECGSVIEWLGDWLSEWMSE